MIHHWIKAFRLRTLPLALASIGMGTFLATASGNFKFDVFVLCVLTTTFLQVLSNLANDYGDSIHGVDHAGRQGPRRAVQSGIISKTAMRRAIILFAVLSFISGVSLIYLSLGWSLKIFAVFLGIGLLAIIAAITYTAGDKPYAYRGFGDLSVLIFFGFVAVMGSAYLYEQTINWQYALPAISIGLFSVAVLNVNNIRDIESDRSAGKYSIPVRLGREKAVVYHWTILILGFFSTALYIVLNYLTLWQVSIVLVIPLLIRNGRAVSTRKDAWELDPFLKQMALTTLLFVILFGFGQLMSLGKV